MKRKTFLLAGWLLHLLLLWGNVVTQSTTSSSGAATSSSLAATTAVTSTAANTTISAGTSTAASTVTTETSTTDLSGTSTAASTVTTETSTTDSAGTSTAETASASPSTSTASPENDETLNGSLRPWEVALIALASVAMGVILSTGLAISLRNSPCVRNFSTDLYHPHGPSVDPCPHGYHGVENMPRATGMGPGDDCPPDAMELTGRHCYPECP